MTPGRAGVELLVFRSPDDVAAAAVPPKILPFTFGDQLYEQGMSAQVQCIVVEGDAPLDIGWNVVADADSSSSGVQVTRIGAKSSVLLIDSITEKHNGNYTCKAANAAGTQSFSAQLTVVGPFLFFFCVFAFFFFIFAQPGSPLRVVVLPQRGKDSV